MKIKENLDKILNGDISINYSGHLRNIILESNILGNKCLKCSLDKWFTKDITLEIHHVDGNRDNNRKINLELLCPNCHSITENYKKRKPKPPILKTEWVEVIKNNPDKSINYILVSILKTYNTQHNYIKVKKVCNKYNLPIPKKKREIPSYDIIKDKYSYYKGILDKSEINYSKRTWGVEVARILNITPQYALRLVKTKYKYLLKN